MSESSELNVDDEPQAVSLGEALRVWCRVAALSFGGPAGQIAVMHRILVDEKKWISEERFLHALNYCMLLPGPEAQQLATYIGWLMHRAIGGLMAGVLFVLPGFAAILVLSILYARYQELAVVQAVFFGLKPAVMAIVLEAVLRIGRRVLKNGAMVSLAAASFVAIFFFNVPFPALVAAAAVIGFAGGRFAPAKFVVVRGGGRDAATSTETAAASPTDHARADVRPSLSRAAAVSAICLTLWFGPLLAIGALAGRESVFWLEGLFFSKAAVVTFGGAYAALAYVAQQAVEKYGWLMPGEMLDGLGMAETTPGPLIMVVQFVGFMGAYRHPGGLDPLLAGVLGSLVTTWVTFVPCFYWIFLGAPYIERLRGSRLLSAALSAITAAVVGVILNLAVWFSLHTLFASVNTRSAAGMRLFVPDWSTLNVASLAIAVLACGLTFWWKRGMAVTLAVCAAAGMAMHFVLPAAQRL
ncbi:MAG: chromate efflux transporter [Pirellulales bacterium]